jgi:pimeloyl-ACP methyl ester carboxylesterase
MSGSGRARGAAPPSWRLAPLREPTELSGRLAASEMYPAHDHRVAQRMLALPSGVRVRLVEAGRSDGPPVVLLHGWGAGAYTYRENLPALAAAGLRASAVELKGHGLSDKPWAPGEYDFPSMRDHVLEVIDALGADRPAIVAPSMTGAIALELALAEETRVSRVALINPVGLCAMPLIPFACALTPSPTVRVAPWLVRRWAMAAGLRLVYGDPRRVTARDVDEYWAPSQFPGYARAMRALVHEFHWPPIASERLAALRIPVLTILGARDRVVRGARPVAERLPGGRVVLVPGGGHAVNEEMPDVVNPVLVKFLVESSAR